MAGEEIHVDVSAVTISDIDDTKIALSSLNGKVVVLVGGGQGALEESTKWGRALAKECSALQDVKFRTLAFLGSLPPFIPKAFVKDSLKKMSIPPWIDWDGASAKVMGMTDSNAAYVFVIDKKGVLRFRLTGKFSDDDLKTVMEQAKKLNI